LSRFVRGALTDAQAADASIDGIFEASGGRMLKRKDDGVFGGIFQRQTISWGGPNVWTPEKA
jgi:hypothetical protein